jgi:hypothetical protein
MIDQVVEGSTKLMLVLGGDPRPTQIASQDLLLPSHTDQDDLGSEMIIRDDLLSFD